MKPNLPQVGQYKCQVCGRMFDTLDELREHEKTHVLEPAGVGLPPHKEEKPQ